MSRDRDGWRTSERAAIHLAGMLFVVLACFGLHILMFRPSNAAMALQQKRLTQLRSIIDQKPQSVLDYQSAMEQSKELKLRVAQFRKRLPKQPDVNQLLNELSSTARRLDLKVLAIQPTQQTSGELASAQHVKLRISGTYASVCRLLDQLRELHSVTWVIGIKMSSDAIGSQLQPVELDMALLFAPESSQVGQMPIEPRFHRSHPRDHAARSLSKKTADASKAGGRPRLAVCRRLVVSVRSRFQTRTDNTCQASVKKGGGEGDIVGRLSVRKPEPRGPNWFRRSRCHDWISNRLYKPTHS
ncbi:MAG: type 4a pilus biogenesis protein PilO [Pirellulaceae bacterium]